MQKTTKYFVAAFAVVALFAGYTYFGSGSDTTDTTNAATATITAPTVGTETVGTTEKTGNLEVVPTEGGTDVDANSAVK